MPTNEEETGLIKTSKELRGEVALAVDNKTIADKLLAHFDTLISQNQLTFPKGYAVGNQLKLAFSQISQNKDLAVCTPESIAEGLAEFVIQGLEIEKKQAYFIKRGNKLTLFRSYYGDSAVAKRTKLVKEIFARPIYQDDTYEIITDDEGLEQVANHHTGLTNRDKEIIGGYAWAVNPEGKKRYCIMTRKEIDAAWAKSSDPSRNVQKTFPQEMTKRTTIRRLVKTIFNDAPSDISDEAKAIIRSYNKTTEDEYDNDDKIAPARKSTLRNIPTDKNGEVITETDVKPVPEDITPEEFCAEKGIK